jgi:hypothetical protein
MPKKEKEKKRPKPRVCTAKKKKRKNFVANEDMISTTKRKKNSRYGKT